MSTVKCGVEASDLGHVGHAFENDIDGGEVVRLVERSEHRQLFQFAQDLAGDHSGTGKPRTAMDHAVAHANEPTARMVRLEPCCQRVDGRATVVDGRRQQIVEPFLPATVFDRHPWRRPDPLDLAPYIDMPAVPADCWNTQNFRLDEPAFSTRAYASMTPPSRLGPPGENDKNGDRTPSDRACLLQIDTRVVLWHSPSAVLASRLLRIEQFWCANGFWLLGIVDSLRRLRNASLSSNSSALSPLKTKNTRRSELSIGV